MHLNPNIELTDKQFLALQERAMGMNLSVEQMIQKEVSMIAVREMAKDTLNHG